MSKERKTKIEDFDRAVDWEEIAPILQKAIYDYEGDLTVLESAVGALFVGLTMGSRVLRIIHGKGAYSKYEKILGIKFREVCRERGVWSAKSRGLAWADSLGDFWEAVKSSKIPREDRNKTNPIPEN